MTKRISIGLLQFRLGPHPTAPGHRELCQAGPSQRDRLSQDEIELIARTARRTPEVMVKVLSPDSRRATSAYEGGEGAVMHSERTRLYRAPNRTLPAVDRCEPNSDTNRFC